MEQYKTEFIDLLMKTGAMRFGQFTLKSGRISPYFINMGGFADGESFSRLSYFYASKIMDVIDSESFDMIFGPAYKGISLAAGTCLSLYRDFGQNKAFAYNRKEIKDYGYDKGTVDGQIAKYIVGAKIVDGTRIVIIDDVFTAGTAKYETMDLLNSVARSLKFRAVLFAVDRQETGDGGESAVEMFTRKTGISTESIINVLEIMEHLVSDGRLKGESLELMLEYLRQYGTKTVKEHLHKFSHKL